MVVGGVKRDLNRKAENLATEIAALETQYEAATTPSSKGKLKKSMNAKKKERSKVLAEAAKL